MNYTPEQKEYIDNYIRSNYGKLSNKEIGNNLGLKENTINKKLWILGIEKINKKNLPLEVKKYREKFILDNFDKLSNKEISLKLGLSTSYISNIYSKLGFKRNHNSKYRIDKIAELFLNGHTPRQISRILNISELGVSTIITNNLITKKSKV